MAQTQITSHLKETPNHTNHQCVEEAPFTLNLTKTTIPVTPLLKATFTDGYLITEYPTARYKSINLDNEPTMERVRLTPQLSLQEKQLANQNLVKLTDAFMSSVYGLSGVNSCAAKIFHKKLPSSLRSGSGLIIRFTKQMTLPATVDGPDALYPHLTAVSYDNSGHKSVLKPGITYLFHSNKVRPRHPIVWSDYFDAVPLQYAFENFGITEYRCKPLNKHIWSFHDTKLNAIHWSDRDMPIVMTLLGQTEVLPNTKYVCRGITYVYVVCPNSVKVTEEVGMQTMPCTWTTRLLMNYLRRERDLRDKGTRVALGCLLRRRLFMNLGQNDCVLLTQSSGNTNLSGSFITGSEQLLTAVYWKTLDGYVIDPYTGKPIKVTRRRSLGHVSVNGHDDVYLNPHKQNKTAWAGQHPLAIETEQPNQRASS